MLNKRVGSLALVLITVAAAGLYGCGSDDDTVAAGGSGGGGASGASGSAGKGGGGSGGKAGSGGTGTAGTAGSAEAGAAGMSGSAPSEEGGMGGAAPGTGGAAGEAEGGSGGEAGGAPMLSLADACKVVCADQTGLSCTFGTKCMDDCTGNETMSPAPPEEYDAMFECEAAHLTAATYECSDQGGGLIWPAAKDGTTCEAAICKWTCDDGGILADVNIFERCGC